jgi:hypothetical protein
MPWTIEDVDKHKKGLTDKQKNQWVRISNSVLKRCMDNGGDEKTCAVSAIKQANGVVQVNSGLYSVYKNKQKLDYEPKLLFHQEKAHLVVPVVMMVEGVHSGSQGALFHSIDELGKFPESWNGIPVVIYHPEEDGQAISANYPDVIDKMTVGRVYNTQVEGKKLKAEVWFDEEKLNTVSPQTLNDVNETKEVEVSLGMFTENEMEEGDYNGEKYVAIATNHRPDHLAILPDQIGACSCADGCGLGVNTKVKDVNPEPNPDEEPDDELTLDKKCKKKQSTEVNSGGVALNSTVVESVGLTRNINNNKGGQKMANNGNCPKCLEKINALIANTASKFEEADREWLLTQEESVLDKLAPVEVEKIVEKTVEVNKLSTEDQAALAFGKKQMKERKEKMVKGILDNTAQGIWDSAMLTNMSEDILEKMYNSFTKEEPVNYQLNSGINTNAVTEEPLYPAGVTIKK